MPRPEPRRAVTSRHTLGSLPEAHEPLHPPIMPMEPALAPLHNLTDGAEPAHTIYGAGWYAARQRAHAATGNGAAELVRLLDVIETGWHALRDLQHWYDTSVARADAGGVYGHLLGFVDADVVDVFREIAGGAAELVPGSPGWAAEADPDGVVGDVDAFVRYLTLLHLATQAAPVPEPFAALVASVAERFTGWGEEVSALVCAAWEANGPAE